MSDPSDPFNPAREDAGVLRCEFQGESVPMILRHEDVRKAAKDWKTFSSDAPFRVPIPSEEDVRSMRQIPVEVDPPEHGEYREIVEPFFRRAKEPAVVAQVEALIDGMLTAALGRESIEVVWEFALPLQSRALTYLLNVPETEAETWITWGVHVFREGLPGQKKGEALDTYLRQAFDRAAANPGDDLFSALTRATFRGRPLSREEMMGFANLTFAGGRDTVIFTICGVIAYLGQHPEALEFLRADPARITLASEEFFASSRRSSTSGGSAPWPLTFTAYRWKPMGASRSAGLRRIAMPQPSTRPMKCASTASRTPTLPSASARTSASAHRMRACSCVPCCRSASSALPASPFSPPRSMWRTRPATSGPWVTNR